MNQYKKKYYFTYTALFVFVCLFVFSYYYLNGRTFINQRNDGMVQHYKALVYYSDYLKQIFNNLIHDHRLIMPRWDFNIGEGADILQTLHCYTIGDPLSVFSVFFPKEKMYLYYDVSIIIRLYLAGIVFSELCFYTEKKNSYAVLAGAIVYVFSYWGLLHVNEHIYFLNPLIYLPLIILGIEMIIRDDKPYLFTIAVFITALSNFYFFYIIVVLTVIYVSIRFICLYRSDLNMMMKKLLILIIYSVWGTLMAAIIFFPVMRVFLGIDRVSVDNSTGLLYSRFYYERLPSVLLSDDMEYDLCMGFASAVLLAISLVLKKPKKNILLLSLGVMTLLMVCLPVAGKILNGFAYVINRWSFAISLLASYILVSQWEEFKGNRLYLLIFLALFALASMVSPWNRKIRVFVPVAIGFLFIFISNLDLKKKRYDIRQMLMIALIILNIFYNADYDYSVRGKNRKEYAASADQAVSEISHSDAEIYKENVNDDDFCRYSGRYLAINAGMVAGVPSTDFYWSITNPYIVSYREKLGLCDYTSYIFRGYDDRPILYSLANVKYFLGRSQEEIPYGFRYLKDIEYFGLYKNEYDLPFGYTYTDTLSYEKWNSLNPIERQSVMLDYVVIEDGDDSVRLSGYQDLEYEFVPDENVIVEDGNIAVSEEKSQLRVRFNEFDGDKNLYITALEFIDTDGYIEENNTPVTIKVSYGDEEKQIYYYTRDYQYYAGRHDFSLCLGRNSQEITITFPFPGIYAFDELSFAGTGYEDYDKKINRLKENHLEDLVMDNDRIQGRISVSEGKYLLLSIPYAEGWEAFVDGEKTKIIRANETYMAVRLEKGEHTIEMKYHTPLLKASALVSLASCLVFILHVMKSRKEENRS